MVTPRFLHSFNRLFIYLFIGLLDYWIIGLFIPLPVFAQAAGCGDVATIGCLETMFASAVKGVLSISVVALFIAIIVGGYKFIFSGGDAKKLEGAKGTISGAILGMVVIVLAYLIIKLIGTIAGTPGVTQFKVL
mgnify:CR=1 FL=1